MNKFIIVGIVVFFSFINTAFAETKGSDVYVKIGVGYTNIDSTEAKLTSAAAQVHSMTLSSENTLSYQLGVGYVVNKYFTTELVLQHNSESTLNTNNYTVDGVSSTATGAVDIESQSLLLYGLIDIPSLLNKDWKLKPYLGIGVGLTNNKLNRFIIGAGGTSSELDKNSETNFAWKATLGTTYPLADNFLLDLSYSYADYGQVKSSSQIIDNNSVVISPLTFDLKTQELFLSMRYLF